MILKQDPELKKSSLTCRHSSFLQVREEGNQDCYHWSLVIDWSRVALIQLIHSLCSYPVRVQNLPHPYLSHMQGPTYKFKSVFWNCVLRNIPAFSQPYPDCLLLPQSSPTLLPLFCQKMRNISILLSRIPDFHVNKSYFQLCYSNLKFCSEFIGWYNWKYHTEQI